MVEDFLSHFIFATSKAEDEIDLNLILKALPVRVEKSNVYRIDLFNFESVQASLTAFTNTDQDERFKYFDDRNNARLRKLRIKATTTEALTEKLKNLSSTVTQILETIQEKTDEGGGGIKVLQRKRTENLSITQEEVQLQLSRGIQNYFDKSRHHGIDEFND